MHSVPRLISIEVKAKEEEVDGLNPQKTKPVTIMNTQSIHNTLTTLKVRGEEARDGPISPIFSVTTARSMVTMNENVERSNHTRAVVDPMSLKKK